MDYKCHWNQRVSFIPFIGLLTQYASGLSMGIRRSPVVCPGSNMKDIRHEIISLLFCIGFELIKNDVFQGVNIQFPVSFNEFIS